jgi:YbbR domain-containing protein
MNRRTPRRPSGAPFAGLDEKLCGIGRAARAPGGKAVNEMKSILSVLRDLIAKHGWLKFSALLLAFALWLMVRGDESERVVTVPLAVQVPRNMEIVSERPSTVEVTVSGGSNLSGRLPEMTYTIDLHEAAEGQHTVPLTLDGVWVNPTADVRVVRVSPARVSIELERIVSRELPVRALLQGNPPDGMEVYEVACEPGISQVTGRRSQIDPLREVTTAPVIVSRQEQSFQTKVNIRLQSDDIHASPAEVQVRVELGARRVEQTVTVPVTVPDPQVYSASPPAVAVCALVPLTFNRPLAPEDFRAVVALPAEETAEGQAVAKPEVVLTAPAGTGIRIRQVQPETVTLIHRSRKK